MAKRAKSAIKTKKQTEKIVNLSLFGHNLALFVRKSIWLLRIFINLSARGEKN